MVSRMVSTQFSADLERVGASADPEAQAAFDNLSFTHRREYVEWVEEEKRAGRHR
jgi:bacteriocin resistance YdeI/OmpD-like protein